MCEKPDRSAWFAWFMGSDMSGFLLDELPSRSDKLKLTMLALLPAVVLLGLPLSIMFLL